MCVFAALLRERRRCPVVAVQLLDASRCSLPACLPACIACAAVEEAATRFYCSGLLRRALHILRGEAETSRAGLHKACAHWRQRQQAAVLLAWHSHAGEAAEWLGAAASAMRRRWLLRHWHTTVMERQWQREAEAAAGAFARRRLLAAAVESWQLGVQHERWRDEAHEAVVCLRLRGVLQG